MDKPSKEMNEVKEWTKNPNNKLSMDFDPEGINVSEDF